MRESLKPLVSVRVAAIVIGMLLICGIVLQLETRPWFCKTGLGFWSNAWKPCTSQHLFDPYTFTHVLHGVIFYWLLWPSANKVNLERRFLIALAIEIAWELVENSPWVVERYRQATASLDYTGDSIINSLGDVVASMIGFALASQFSWKVAVAFFFVVELVLLATIRDNLTLNVVMLLFPLEALKQRQLGAMAH